MSTPEEVTDTVGDEQLGEIEWQQPISFLIEEPLSLVDHEWPTRVTLPLNSKCINLSKWQSIMASLHLLTTETVTETKAS